MIRRVGGAQGLHTLAGPGVFQGAWVAGATSVGAIRVASGNTHLGGIAAASGVGTRASGASVTGPFQASKADGLSIFIGTAGDYVEVDFTGPHG